MAIDQGMNIGEVKALAEQLKTAAGKLDSIVQLLNSKVGSSSWVGPDATKFKNDWWPAHRVRLQQLRTDLEGFGQSAHNNATEQEGASEVHEGGAAGAITPTPLPRDAVPDLGPGESRPLPSPTPAALVGDEAALRSEFQGAYRHDHYINGVSYDKYNFAYNSSGNCTSYVAWRLNDIAKDQGLDWSMSNNNIGDTNGLRLGNAGQWGQSAGAAGYPPNQTAGAGAVAFWDADSGLGGDGHVGIVHSVGADGVIQVEESSWGSSVFSIKSYKPGEKGYPTGFIHLVPGT